MTALSVVEAPFRPKAEPETVAALRTLADRIESGEVTEFSVIYYDPVSDVYDGMRFGSPRMLLTLSTIFHEQTVRNLMDGSPG